MEFCKRLQDNNIDATFFINKNILPLYHQTSAMQAHKVILPPLSKINSEVIADMLEAIGLPRNDIYVISVKALLQPLKSLN